MTKKKYIFESWDFSDLSLEGFIRLQFDGKIVVWRFLVDFQFDGFRENYSVFGKSKHKQAFKIAIWRENDTLSVLLNRECNFDPESKNFLNLARFSRSIDYVTKTSI